MSILNSYKEGSFSLLALSSYRLELFFAQIRFMCKRDNSPEKIVETINNILITERISREYDLHPPTTRGAAHAHTVISGFPKYDYTNYKILTK